MINKLKQKIKEFLSAIDCVDRAAIHRELSNELLEKISEINEENIKMMQTTLKENTMSLQNKEYEIYIGCDDKNLYNELHEAIDNVLKKYHIPTEECEASGPGVMKNG